MTKISLKRRVWGWMMFDWASQPFYTLLLTFIFGPYFAAVATEFYMSGGMEEALADAQAQAVWSAMLAYVGLAIAVTAPVLGAIADQSGSRIRWMYIFSVFYVVSTYALWWMLPDGSNMMITLVAFGIGMMAAEYALVFINSMLTSLGPDEEVGKVSGSGFALGYAGGVVALLIMLLLFAEGDNGKTLIGLDPVLGLDASEREGTRAVGPFTAIWYVVFMIPFFAWVKEAPAEKSSGGIGAALSGLMQSVKNVAKRPSLASYLASSMFYRDALNALYGFGGVYAVLVLDWSITLLGVFGILAAISAAVFTYIGGLCDKRFGPKPVILFNIWMLIIVCVVIVGMSRESFYGIPLAEGSGLPDLTLMVLGAIIGASGGAVQGASRTMMVRHANPERPTEAFGLYALSGKATAFLAPALIGMVTYMTSTARLGLSPVIVLFIIALILLRWVKPDGDRAEWDGSSKA
ncbi:MFS transporter [Cognatishimia activa]|uniref:MFS transporter n=1 Tax=Cognatishimia activa TaxID=1715691 RepID=A0A975ESY7_9RHOB|nr:MFS transporter [Cognatishimia activa]QTN37267.1 MFS transporter [Cognatishimia activa]